MFECMYIQEYWDFEIRLFRPTVLGRLKRGIILKRIKQSSNFRSEIAAALIYLLFFFLSLLFLKQTAIYLRNLFL